MHRFTVEEVPILVLEESLKFYFDAANKIMVFSQQGHKAVFILSTNGAISHVTLQQPLNFGATVTYEAHKTKIYR